MGLHNLGFRTHFGQAGQPFELVVGIVSPTHSIFEQSFAGLHNWFGETINCAFVNRL